MTFGWLDEWPDYQETDLSQFGPTIIEAVREATAGLDPVGDAAGHVAEVLGQMATAARAAAPAMELVGHRLNGVARTVRTLADIYRVRQRSQPAPLPGGDHYRRRQLARRRRNRR